MYLKISSPEGIIYEGQVKEVNVPTEAGYIWILPWHVPLVSVVKPGILKFKPIDNPEDDFIFEDEYVHITVSKGLIMVDWDNIVITTSKSVVSPTESKEILEKMRKDLEKQIEELKAKWSIEEIEKAMINLQTIEAELKLLQKKGLLK